MVGIKFDNRPAPQSKKDNSGLALDPPPASFSHLFHLFLPTIVQSWFVFLGKVGKHMMRRFWQRLKTCDRTSLFGWLCVVAVITIYTVIYFNRFMFPQEGWFNAHSQRILSGQIPYRDFHLFLQPIYSYLMAALNAVFGYDFIVFRIYGIFERLFLVSMVYLIYGRIFKPWMAAFCAIGSLVLCWSFNVDSICSYYQLSLAFVLLSLWLLLKFFDEEKPTKKLIYLVSAGLACSLSFMVKQTLGLAFPFVAVILIILQSIKSEGGVSNLFKLFPKLL